MVYLFFRQLFQELLPHSCKCLFNSLKHGLVADLLTHCLIHPVFRSQLPDGKDAQLLFGKVFATDIVFQLELDQAAIGIIG